MSDFLSAAWFERLNATLAAAGPANTPGNDEAYRVVLDFLDGPAATPPALTFTLNAEGARLAPGYDVEADTFVRLTYADALALTTGVFDSATALREGRVKVRGDMNALVPLLTWLQRAHPQAPSTSSSPSPSPSSET